MATAPSSKLDPAQEEESELPQQERIAPQVLQYSEQMEYDYVEQPSQDFFCPVTLELLIDPHLTMCCGNHLSREAANRLQRDGKPCPMCKEPLNAVPNKHYKRKVNEIKVRCPHKKSGCEWVGGINEVKQHSDSCPYRPWKCHYCDFASTYDIGIAQHVPKCPKYPVVCPNSCEIVSVPRSKLEAHLMVCPLELVACEYAEVGCDAKVLHRDLARHMEEAKQQHMSKTTLFNIQKSKEDNTRLQRTIEDQNKAIADLRKQLNQAQEQAQKTIKEKEVEIAVKTQQMKNKETEFQKELGARDEEIKKKDKLNARIQKQLKEQQELVSKNEREISEKTANLRKKQAEFQKDLATKDQRIKERDQTIKVKDHNIADLQKQLKQVQEQAQKNLRDKDAQFAAKEQQFKSKEVELQKQLTTANQSIGERNAKIQEKDKTIADLQKELKALEDDPPWHHPPWHHPPPPGPPPEHCHGPRGHRGRRHHHHPPPHPPHHHW